MKRCFFVLIGLAFSLQLFAQSADRRDPVVFSPQVDATLDKIKEEVKPPEVAKKNRMWVDFSTIKAPAAPAEFTQVWHFPPLRQGMSGMCWCFSTTSLLESEIKRQTGREIKLSEMYTVYWEYVEKVKEFVRTRGASVLGEGSQAEAMLRAMRTHGAVPATAYTGLVNGLNEHDHTHTLFEEIRQYTDSVKKNSAWNEAEVVATVRAILDHYLGAPPEKITIDGKDMTPQDYLLKVARLNPDDYVAFLSIMDQPYWKRAEYAVPDNWWHGKNYLNVPLDDFMAAIKNAIRKGYSLAVAADMSEAGYSIGPPGIAVVPDFDIPSNHIDERARQFRFSNETTTDDHGLHLVGYRNLDGQDWFLIKDSWSSAWNNSHPGYYFFHEDYVKLKILSFLVHKDAVKDLLAKEIK